MAEELAKDYAAYMDVGLNGELRVVQDTVDDMLTRLDEFENLVSMIRAESGTFIEGTVPNIAGCLATFTEFCNRINRLEKLVARVEADLTHVEEAVEQATSDLEDHSSGRLRTFLKPLFFKSNEPAVKKPTRQTPTCEVGEIFATDDFFPSSVGESKNSS